MTSEEFKSTLEIIGLDYLGNIPKREIFSLAKEFQFMTVAEVVKLLHESNQDLRLSAVAILDWKARNKKTTEIERKDAFHAYIDNPQLIENWGMVDRAAPYVVGGYLFDKERDILYQMAKSDFTMERRTAIVSTYFFIRQDDVEDTFKIAEILVHDEEEFVQTAVGSWIREAGKRDEQKLINFLDKYSTSMPRIMLRYAIEKLDKTIRTHYLSLKNT
jgi:3-methyladenine DNA glycosylase AlkD